MPAEIDGVKLQLAMAFGQGAGAMMASPEALETLLKDKGEIIGNARRSWDTSRWAFVELVRILGQLSATRAAVDGSAEIRWSDIEVALPVALALCPCVAQGEPRRR